MRKHNLLLAVALATPLATTTGSMATLPVFARSETLEVLEEAVLEQKVLVENLAEQVKTKEEMVKTYTKQVEEFKRVANATETLLPNAKEEVKKAEALLAEAQNNLAEANTVLNSAKTAQAEAEQKVASLRENNASAEEIASAEEELVQAQAKIDEANRVVESATNEKGVVEGLVEKKKGELTNVQQAIAEATENYKKGKEQLDKLNKELKDKQNAYNNSYAKYQKIAQEYERLCAKENEKPKVEAPAKVNVDQTIQKAQEEINTNTGVITTTPPAVATNNTVQTPQTQTVAVGKNTSAGIELVGLASVSMVGFGSALALKKRHKRS